MYVCLPPSNNFVIPTRTCRYHTHDLPFVNHFGWLEMTGAQCNLLKELDRRVELKSSDRVVFTEQRCNKKNPGHLTQKRSYFAPFLPPPLPPLSFLETFLMPQNHYINACILMYIHASYMYMSCLCIVNLSVWSIIKYMYCIYMYHIYIYTP